MPSLTSTSTILITIEGLPHHARVRLASALTAALSTEHIDETMPIGIAAEEISCRLMDDPGNPTLLAARQQIKAIADHLWLASDADYFVGPEISRSIQLTSHLDEMIRFESDGQVCDGRLLCFVVPRNDCFRGPFGSYTLTVQSGRSALRDLTLRIGTADVTNLPQVMVKVKQEDWYAGRGGLYWTKTPQN